MNDKRQGKRGTKSKHTWSLMSHEYITSPDGPGEITYADLAEKYDCSEDVIKQRAATEKWKERRKQHRDDIVNKTLKKDAETAAQRRHRHAKGLKIIQTSALRGVVQGDEVAKPKDYIEAVKAERALYGETGEVVQVNITEQQRKIADAYWELRRKQVEEEGASGGGDGE